MRKPEKINLLLLLFLLFMLAGCWAGSIKKYGNIYLDRDTTITLSDRPENEVKILYTGCGGMVVNSDSFSVLIDPFYSYKGLSIAWQKLATDKQQADRVCDRIDDQCGGTGRISSVLIAHAHYDHLLDLPYLMNSRLRRQRLKIIGSHAAANALSNVSLPDYDFEEPQFTDEIMHATFRLNDEMVVDVIPSAHAPHIKLLGLKVKAMNGEIGPAGVAGFDAPDYKAWCWNWKEGQDYSFLIEIRKPNTPKPFRIFIQSSSCAPPAGIPQFLHPGDSVDLAFIGVASGNYVNDYPQSLLKAIRPHYVILIHWEDFFRPYGREPKVVRATSLKKFLCRYQQVMGDDYALRTSMPKQLTRYIFKY